MLRRFRNDTDLTFVFPGLSLGPGEEKDVEMPEEQTCPLYLTETTAVDELDEDDEPDDDTSDDDDDEEAVTEPAAWEQLREPQPNESVKE